MVRKVKKDLEAVGRQVERRIFRMAGGAYAVWMMTALMCQAALMTLGAIVTYMEKIIPKSSFTP